jgi:hypothetical protein
MYTTMTCVEHERLLSECFYYQFHSTKIQLLYVIFLESTQKEGYCI